MDEQKREPDVKPSDSKGMSKLPLLLVLLLLLLLLPLTYFVSRAMLEACLKALPPAPAPTTAIVYTNEPEVLGLTNLTVDSQLDQAEGGDTVNFNVLGNNEGPLSNGVVTFNTIGKGTIKSAPVGSGVCLKISDTQATCTNVNLLSNEEVSYVVPVVVDTTCGLLNGDDVGLNVNVDNQTSQDATASGKVGCVNAAGVTTTPTSGTTTTPTGGNGQPTPTGNGGPGQNPDGTPKPGDRDSQLAACYMAASNVQMAGMCLSLILLLLLIVLLMMAMRKQQR